MSDDLPEPMAFSVKEAARQLGVGYMTVFKMCRDGRITPVRTAGAGSKIIIPRTEIQRFFNEKMEAERIRSVARIAKINAAKEKEKEKRRVARVERQALREKEAAERGQPPPPPLRPFEPRVSKEEAALRDFEEMYFPVHKEENG